MGAVVLANALKQNSGLRELHIKGNELGDAGTTAICDALKGKSPWTFAAAGVTLSAKCRDPDAAILSSVVSKMLAALP